MSFSLMISLAFVGDFILFLSFLPIYIPVSRYYIKKYTGIHNLCPYLILSVLLKMPLILFGYLIIAILGAIAGVVVIGGLIYTYKMWDLDNGYFVDKDE